MTIQHSVPSGLRNHMKFFETTAFGAPGASKPYGNTAFGALGASKLFMKIQHAAALGLSMRFQAVSKTIQKLLRAPCATPSALPRGNQTLWNGF